MNKEFDIQKYLTQGVEKIVREVLRSTMQDPRESAFMARFAAASVKASRRRKKLEKEGLHVPAYLIASTTSSCNLHCAGCYSRANHATSDCAPKNQLTADQWLDIFSQAEELGISFIFLVGGEPLLRRDVIEAAAQKSSILFPVFTNGTFMNDACLDLFDRSRNLLPVVSMEGDRECTDARRGEGIYDRVLSTMERFRQKGLLYGCSVTVTTQNLNEALSESFVRSMKEKGCRAVFYIEYIPISEGSLHLAPTDDEREIVKTELERLRAEHPDIIFISFPGDEKSSGGCLAAGRGFFHINSHGGAEPCPVSAYSDINVAETSLKEAINSRLFKVLREEDYLLEEHAGGCVLYNKREQIEQILAKNRME